MTDTLVVGIEVLIVALLIVGAVVYVNRHGKWG